MAKGMANAAVEIDPFTVSVLFGLVVPIPTCAWLFIKIKININVKKNFFITHEFNRMDKYIKKNSKCLTKIVIC